MLVAGGRAHVTGSRPMTSRSRKWRVTTEGVGTPFPTERSSWHLIVGGPYRYVRNPMYLAFVAAIIGQALLLSSPVLLICAAALVAFVHWLDESRQGSSGATQGKA